MEVLTSFIVLIILQYVCVLNHVAHFELTYMSKIP